MKYILKQKKLWLLSVLILSIQIHSSAQNLSEFKSINSENLPASTIQNKIQFNGYTNHWQNNYTEWYRYGNLFKMAVSDVPPTILQSKIDIADDLGLTGLFMEEGFFTHLYASKYKILKNPESCFE